jgi:hypothetical protein
VLVFASYTAPGMHRLSLDARKNAWLRLGNKNMQLLDGK